MNTFYEKSRVYRGAACLLLGGLGFTFAQYKDYDADMICIFLIAVLFFYALLAAPNQTKVK